MEIPKVYNPKETEQKWYNFWLENNSFVSHPDKSRKPFTIVIPPPNVTGALHIGHALNNTLQDVIIRFRRQQGYNALWVPGTDHGGIATQNVVERLLIKEDKTRMSLGREKFLERMWAFKNASGDTILNQLKRLGCSLDWTRTRNTLDEICSRAVEHGFVELYKRGLIYRGNRMVNWCPRCRTALADIEVEHREEKSKLWYIRYPLKSGNCIVVATTRPETMLGDTAVAVNSKDVRYKDLVGRTVILPLVNREIPVISCDLVDISFGTGAVKVTPSHDFTDFEIATRCSLPFIEVIDSEGKMTSFAGSRYVGLDRYECREKVILDLQSLDLIEKIDDYIHSVGTCYRCHTVIEPQISMQWFLSVREMADKSLESIKSGRVKFYPESWAKSCIVWLENLQDWCLSRQIWWGHRIPVWYCQKNCPPIASLGQPEKCPNCGNTNLEQDPDVLDSWFSSALWPFSVFGWPATDEISECLRQSDLKYYYPTSVLVTGYEILYLWVARMIMMGLEFMNEVPFKEVYIHGIVRDIYGKKMSKSLGNVIDPLQTIEQYGTDALRFALTQCAAAGRDIQLSEDGLIGARNFANKIWNASRFVLMNIEGLQISNFKFQISDLDVMDKWIVTEFNQLVVKVTDALQNYNLPEYARLMYEFFWAKFCDWYLEFIKPRLNSPGEKIVVQQVLVNILYNCLKLLHPVMPYITEEIYQRIKLQIPGLDSAESIVKSFWPEYNDKYVYSDAIDEIGFVMQIIKDIRTIRTDMNVLPKKLIEITVNSPDGRSIEILKKYLPQLELMCKVSKISTGDTKPQYSAVSVVGSTELYVLLEGIIDFGKEKLRLEKKYSKLKSSMEILDTKLSDSKFLARAPEKEIEKLKFYRRENENELLKIKKYLADITL